MGRILCIWLALFCLPPIPVKAEGATTFSAAAIFTDNMVLQADREIVIYGTSPDAGETLLVFLEEEKREAVVSNGRWEARFPSRAAGGEPFAIQIIGGNEAEHIFIENVTVGDVWIVLGQSNVEFNATALPNWDEKSMQLPKNARLITYTSQDLTEKETGARSRMWRPMTYLSAAQSSALGVLLTEGISISTGFSRPIGLISAGFRGQELAAFLPRKMTKGMETVEKETSQIYEAVLSELAYFPIKGMVWYQGEANGTHYKEYAEKFSAFIADWRQTAGPFPVYAVELMPCFPGEGEAGRQFLDFGTVRGIIGTLPLYVDALTVCPTSDLFSDRAYPNSLHPPNKTVLSERVLQEILIGSYSVPISGSPQLREITYGDTKREIRLSFSAPLSHTGEEILGFTAINKDWNPVPVTPEMEGETVTLSAEEEICIVRYGTRYDDVFGETITLCGENGQPVPQIWHMLTPPDTPSKFSFALLYIVHYAVTLWPLWVLLILLGGWYILRKRKRQ